MAKPLTFLRNLARSGAWRRPLVLILFAAAVLCLPPSGPTWAQTGIRLESAAWIPARDERYGWWGVVAAGGSPKNPLQQSKTDGTLSVPPGAYDVYWVQDYDTSDAPLLLAAGINVEAGQVATVRADSGVSIEIAGWVPARDENYGWWGAVPAGAGPKQRVQWTNASDALLVPPGTYDIYWVQGYDTSDKPLLLAAGVDIEAGQVAAVRADSGIALKVPADTPAMDENYGWWGVTAPGADPSRRIHWSEGRFDLPLMLPPGTYDVHWQQDYDSKPERRAAGVSVAAGQLTEIDLSAATAGAGQAATASVLTSLGVTSQDGSGLGADFPLGVRRVDVTFSWKDAGTGLRIDIRWSKDGLVVLEQNETVDQAEGKSTWYLTMQSDETLPAGRYQVQILEDGQALAPAMPFTVGLAAPSQAEADLAKALNEAEQGGGASSVPDAVATPGELLVTDDFEDPNSGWQHLQATGVEAGYRDGHYRVAIAATPNLFTIAVREGPAFDDVIVEVEATQEAGSPAHPFGLVARGQDQSNFHAFVIGADGSFAAVRSANGQTALDSALDATLPAGTLGAAGQANRLRLVADGPKLGFYVNDRLVIEIPQASWSSGHAGIFVSTTGAAPVAVTFDNWRVWRIARAEAPPAIAAASPEINSAGFPQFSLGGFSLKDSRQTDASPSIEGAETTVEVFASAAGDEVNRFSTGSVIWGYGWLPGGEAAKGYLLRDPECTGILTEKWAPNSDFSAPDCAVRARRSDAGTVDFAAYAPKDPQSAIKEVAFGYAEADENGYDPARSGTQLPHGTSQAIVWFRFADAAPPSKLAARWYLENDVLYEMDYTLEQADGSAWFGLVNENDRPLPDGNYRVELIENGRAMTTIPFSILAEAGEKVPWSGRGWSRAADGGYVNSAHGLRLTMPVGWVVSDEMQLPIRYLWLMGKLGPDGHSRLDVVVVRRKDRRFASARELFDAELPGIEAATVQVGGATMAMGKIIRSGPTANPEIYEIVQQLTQDGSRAHLLLFVRNGTGYVANFKAKPDATAEEVAELDAVRRSMGL